MTRSDLVEELANRFVQLTHHDAEFAVKAILDAMNDALVRGQRIEIRGFGSFSETTAPPAWAATPAAARVWPFPSAACRTSSPAKRCAKQSTSTRRRNCSPRKIKASSKAAR